jgi:hypothetical protein
MLGVTLIVTLMPFHFEWPSGPRIELAGDPLDVVANIVLFVPLGFFYRIARPAAGSTLRVLAAGAVASLAIETIQYFEPARTPSPLDVATNAAGAWLGALAADRIARAAPAGGRLVGWLALQLPLMGLVYLLVPLLWIDSVSAGDERSHMVLMPLLAAFGAVLLGGMQRHYFAPNLGIGPQRTAAFAALWFVAGAFPLLAGRPVVLMLGALVAVAVCWILGRRPPGVSPGNQRFEVALLTAATPVYAAYFALIVVVPLSHGVAGWMVHWGFTNAGVAQREIMRLLEIVAACTLAGYMAAEFRGRVIASYRDAVPRLLACGLALGCVLEGLWGLRAGHGASIARGALVVGAALYGGWLYYLQRAHVMRLLSQTNRGQAPPAKTGV